MHLTPGMVPGFPKAVEVKEFYVPSVKYYPRVLFEKSVWANPRNSGLLFQQ